VDLAKTVKKFIDAKGDRALPLLLAYSGGPDSKALLYALLEAGIKPHLAHVDHGWREESAREAAELQTEAVELDLPFHSIRLPVRPEKNAEDFCRQERLQYFRKLFDEFPFQALLLAHHKDDVAETALKRIFEGAHLSFLGGMTDVSQLLGMTIWRPLLTVRKKELLAYLKAKSKIGLYDKTNDDPVFLRARLRQIVIPQLATTFGKEIVPNLALLSIRAFELKEYLDRKVASIPKLRGEWGVAFDLKGVERIEARHLLKAQIPSRLQIEVILDVPPKPEGRLFSSNIYVRNGWVAILQSSKELTISDVRNLLRQFNIFLL
jgi:tRNA(Ile)-lysidine synthase